MREFDDGELIRRYRKEKSPELFEKLVMRYMRLGGAIAYSVIGDYELAKDVVQEAFLKVHKSLDKLKEIEKFKSWFYGIVRRTALDHLRRMRKYPRRFSEMNGKELGIGDKKVKSPLVTLDEAERVKLIHTEIENLPTGYKEIVILKYLENRSYKEISEITGLTIQAIESRLWRARNSLKKRFEALSIR